MLYISLWVPCRCKSHAFLCIVITVVECIPMHSHFLPLRPANSPSSSCLSLRHTNADRVLHAIPTWKLSGLSSLPLMCSCRPWAFQISLPALRSCNPLVCCVAKRPLQGHALKAQRLLTQQPPLSHTLMLPHLAYSTSHAQPPPPQFFSSSSAVRGSPPQHRTQQRAHHHARARPCMCPISCCHIPYSYLHCCSLSCHFCSNLSHTHGACPPSYCQKQRPRWHQKTPHAHV